MENKIRTATFYYHKGATIKQAIQAAKELYEEMERDETYGNL